MSKNYVWYVGYGSNLCKERFLCYILGGKFKWGGSRAKGCFDKSLPEADKPIRIPYSLYFAHPSSSWGKKGVAFLSLIKESSDKEWTWGRMWKITYEQYKDVRKQEGEELYNHEIYLGEEDGIPIYTITHKPMMHQFIEPSDKYLKTIILGLKETCALPDDEIVSYLMKKQGIKGEISESNLITIVRSFNQ